jgi:hypothetical protein
MWKRKSQRNHYIRRGPARMCCRLFLGVSLPISAPPEPQSAGVGAAGLGRARRNVACVLTRPSLPSALTCQHRGRTPLHGLPREGVGIGRGLEWTERSWERGSGGGSGIGPSESGTALQRPLKLTLTGPWKTPHNTFFLLGLKAIEC